MKRYAIILGVDHYVPDELFGLKNLQGAIKDAEDVYAWVVSKGGVEAANAYLITSTSGHEQLLKQQVDDIIAKITQELSVIKKEGERIYFYFAGHGLGVEEDEADNGLCMTNWTKYKKDTASLSSKGYLEMFLNQKLFHEVIVWMDCCRTTQLFFRPQGGPSKQPLGTAIPVHMVAYATQYENQAYEAIGNSGSEDIIRGIFTQVLLEVLHANAGNGAFTARELEDYLHINVPLRAKQKNVLQNPDIRGNYNILRPITF